MRLFYILFAALLALPCNAVASERLTIGISQFPSTLHPSFDSMAAKSYVTAMARRPLTTHDTNWEITCLLCTSLPKLDDGTATYTTNADGSDGIAVTYTLDANAVWGDGTPITTEDVQFTWEVGREPTTGIDNFELYQRIEKIDLHDAHNFTLHMNKRTCDYQAIHDFNILPAHIEREYFSDPREYKKRTAYDRDTTNPGLWYGPYRVANIQSGRSILLVRNERWWGKKPYFDEILIRAIENTASLTANLLSGDIDMIAGELGLTIDQALAFQTREKESYKFIFKPGLIYEHIDMNLDNPILADKRVRQALIQSINREAISQQLFAGKQPTAHGQTHPLDSVYYKDTPKYEYNPKAATALLDSAGWALGAKGIRHNAAGDPLRLELMTTAGNKSRELVEQVLQSQWKQMGIDIRIRNEPARVFFGETVNKRKFTGLAMYAWLSTPLNVPRTTLHSSMIPVEKTNWSGQNFTGFNNAEMDQVIDDLEVKCDPQENQELWNRLQTIYAAELPVIPLYFRANSYILPKNLIGLEPTGHQYPSSLWVENWKIQPE